MWNTPDLCDDFADQIFVLPSMYHNYGGVERFFGEVETVKCFEDNSRVKELLATPGRGRVLVVDGGASLRRALIGDMIAAEAIKNGWAGIVIRGACRDVHELKTMAFGVRAMASIPVKSTRKDAGESGLEIDMDGVSVKPGMWLYADETGIVLSHEALTINAC
ncbi:MAG: ribonuclease E activity regulator RraA [Reinekea sp.]|jgi:regulator of ribonuclease activity A